jgi:hypothetical protein
MLTRAVMKTLDLLLSKAVEQGFTYPLNLEIFDGDNSALGQLRFDAGSTAEQVFFNPIPVGVRLPFTVRLTDAEGRGLVLRIERAPLSQ